MATSIPFTLTPLVVFSQNSETRQSLESSLLFQLIADSYPVLTTDWIYALYADQRSKDRNIAGTLS